MSVLYRVSKQTLVVASRDQSELIKDYIRTQPRFSDMNAQFTATDEALRRLGEYYGSGGPMSSRELVNYGRDRLFDDVDWDIIETAPFLHWYLVQYHGISRKVKVEDSSVTDKYDDAPF